MGLVDAWSSIIIAPVEDRRDTRPSIPGGARSWLRRDPRGGNPRNLRNPRMISAAPQDSRGADPDGV
jgi:hypothetical protein